MNQFKVGQKVRFGRSEGQKTLGEVVKVNRTTAKIRQLEERGHLRDYPIGTIWNVSFDLIAPVVNPGRLADAIRQTIQREGAELPSGGAVLMAVLNAIDIIAQHCVGG